MNAERSDVMTRRTPGQPGAHRSPRSPWAARVVQVARVARCRPVRAGAVSTPGLVVVVAVAVTAVTAVTGLLMWSGLWPRITDAVVHHLDTVVAAVLLAGSLAVVWRLSDDGR